MTDAAAIVAWLVVAGIEGIDQVDLVDGYCTRLVAAGVPLWRGSVGADTLHPLIDAEGHRWVQGAGVREERLPRHMSPAQEEDWRTSPWRRLVEANETVLRRRLACGDGVDEFPMLAAFAAQGATDYWARVVRFGRRRNVGDARGIVSSWATRAPDGFAEDHLRLIDATLPAFALAFKAIQAGDTARCIVETYLGRDAAERILRGEIERGRVSTVRRVLWLSDLAGFTRIADTLPRDELLDLLNAYSDCVVGIVHAHGGDVLKFMGDGILAVFGGEAGAAGGRVLDAAVAVQAAVARLNGARRSAGLPVTAVTLALHEGEVLYGNVGSRDRLDFTVVGPAVNELARIQAMSKSLEQPVLVSSSFAKACAGQRDRLVSLGRYALRGVARAQELFTLDAAAADADAR